MTAKHRNKNSSNSTANNNNEKNASPPQHQDDVAKKSQKASKAETPAPAAAVVAAPHPKPSSGSSSGGCVKLLAALCYIALVAGAGVASFYLQQVLEEVNQISSRHQESAQKNAELSQKLEAALQQVGWVCLIKKIIMSVDVLP